MKKGHGLIVFLANLIHKCADGLVIGAGNIKSHWLFCLFIKYQIVWNFLKAFADTLSLGISTALAILFHEIPHELGRYFFKIDHEFFWSD